MATNWLLIFLFFYNHCLLKAEFVLHLTGGDTERAEWVQEQRDGGARVKQTPHQVSVCVVRPREPQKKSKNLHGPL